MFLFSRSSNNRLKADVLLKFHYVSNNAETVKKQVANILHQKLKLNESFLKIDTSLPYLKGKKYYFSLLAIVHNFTIFSSTEKGSLFHYIIKLLFMFMFLIYLIISKNPINTKIFLRLIWK